MANVWLEYVIPMRCICMLNTSNLANCVNKSAWKFRIALQYSLRLNNIGCMSHATFFDTPDSTNNDLTQSYAATLEPIAYSSLSDE